LGSIFNIPDLALIYEIVDHLLGAFATKVDPAARGFMVEIEQSTHRCVWIIDFALRFSGGGETLAVLSIDGCEVLLDRQVRRAPVLKGGSALSPARGGISRKL
jgi:hypothetical protein